MKNLEAFYDSIYALNMEGGWHRRAPALWSEPLPNFLPYVWRYADVRPVLDEAGHLVDHSMADRRNLTMTNPVEGNPYSTVRTLVAAYQSINPGENAEAHRHTPNALRIILQGHGSYTTVNGVRVEMRPGDVLLTPSWNWHSHEAVGSDECFWVDVLDVPFVHLLEPMFFERHPDKFEADVTSVDECALALRWEKSLEMLEAAAATGEEEAERCVELDATPLKTMAVHALRMSQGFESKPRRTTANAIYVVLEGSGVSQVGEHTLNWERGDVFVVPAWQSFVHNASSDSHLIRVSDEPIMKAFDFLRTA